ncbi:hypothetical protein [Actinoallomurus iriomotensis]|uniref:Uncharacterized protein n=1 Tax=Actinoallomurus iriomotensis TaxID=478107 RepID=A0A9W6RIV0_9ACTN|nr:hypothetical protein [Actinoallomurus iriomotensis]GLY74695.1 hypothetical protein Airi01_029620 [Actinoallomurus iriomotensis]
MRSVSSALPAKETAHEYELDQEFLSKLALVPLTGAADRMTLINRQRRHCHNPRGLSDPGHPGQRGSLVASLLVAGARPHLQADLEWLDRRQEALT